MAQRLIKMTPKERKFLDGVSEEDWMIRLRVVAAANLDRLIDKDKLVREFRAIGKGG